MVSGFFTSPCDHWRIFSGDASEMRIALKESGSLGFSKKLKMSFTFSSFSVLLRLLEASVQWDSAGGHAKWDFLFRPASLGDTNDGVPGLVGNTNDGVPDLVGCTRRG